jgi:prepilin-type processing-associated H-X9-DG protein
VYLGWTLDLCDSDDPSIPASGLATALGGSISGDIPSQIFEAVQDPVFAMIANDYATAEAVADTDIDVPQGLGNAGGTTVYRLREGIERFLITDINNPAASAQAQSEVWIMGDNMSVNVGSFNHVPGGSNILYMDGHVDFLRYPQGGQGPGPINAEMANAFSLIDLTAGL